MENQIHPITTIGLASDTSIFGVDAAILETDGADIFKKGTAISRPYSEELKEEIRSILGEKGQLNPVRLKQVEDKVTRHHIETVQSLLERADKSPLQIDVIGFSGHTVLHRPSSKISIQIGDAKKLRDTFNIPVATRFYQTDMAAGGQGSPIFPTFFDAMTREMKKPLAVVSVSGVTSITFLGEFGEMKAFDVGPGNVLIDLWMRERMGAEMDFDGLWAAKGTIDKRLLAKMMKFPAIVKAPPKGLDRDEFYPILQDVEGSTIADGAATLTALTVFSVLEAAKKHLPYEPDTWIITGGGAKNPSIVKLFRQNLQGKTVLTATEAGWDITTLEAQGFAFLAARTLFGLPITFPQTTGVELPLTGGVVLPKKHV